MESIVYSSVDKSAWGSGPWEKEPDRKQWKDASTGYPCLINRGPSGALCGYVGIPKGHPLFGKNYNDRFVVEDRASTPIKNDDPFGIFIESIAEDDGCVSLSVMIEAHGGLTYAEKSDRHLILRPECCRGITFQGVKQKLWVFGFDCAHYRDITPGSDAKMRKYGLGSRNFDSEYRDFNYVKNEVEGLAFQLKKIESTRQVSNLPPLRSLL